MGTLVAILAATGGVVVVALYFRSAHRAKWQLFNERNDSSLHQIYEAEFADSSVTEGRFIELWNEVARLLEAPAGKLRPSDRFEVELSPPKGLEFNDPIHDVKHMIVKHCQRTGARPETIQSIRDYIISFGSTR